MEQALGWGKDGRREWQRVLSPGDAHSACQNSGDGKHPDKGGWTCSELGETGVPSTLGLLDVRQWPRRPGLPLPGEQGFREASQTRASEVLYSFWC